MFVTCMMYMAAFSAILGVGMGLWARQTDPLNAVLLSDIASRSITETSTVEASAHPQNQVSA